MDLKGLVNRYQTAMNAVSRGVNQIFKEKNDLDITADQFTTLQYIRKNQPCTSTEIAQKFGVGKSAVTAQINKLFDKGCIERNRDPNDRRIVYLTVTTAGIDIVESLEAQLYEKLGKQLSHFSREDIEKFIGLLEELAGMMEKE